ncbi:MAG: tetratricopeptide repeat protein [Pseudomonadota bacterium]
MTPSASPSTERYARLALLQQQDPGNALLLADACEAALAAGKLDAARQHAEAGVWLEPDNPGWRYRLAQVLIAQRQLPQARALLLQLRDGTAPQASIDHDLGYIDLLEGRFDDCAQLLAPWVDGGVPQVAAIQALWLRAMHHADRLEDAWRWVEDRQRDGQLTPQAAGVASLVAVDRARMDAAGALAGFALQADGGHVEALLALGCVQLAKSDPAAARAALERAVQFAPHQPRAWSALAFVDMAQFDAQQARAHFEQALQLAPADLTSLHGLGWACAMQQDLAAAGAAFERAVAADASWGESHGSLAVVLALQGDSQRARTEMEQARKLQPGCLSARHAEALLTGQAQRLHGVDKLAQQILGGLGAARRPPRKS